MSADRRRLSIPSAVVPLNIVDVMPDVPVPPKAVIPSGWRLDLGGIDREVDGNARGGNYVDGVRRVSSCPVVISGRLIGIANSRESIRLACYRDGRWKTLDVERRMAMNA